MQYDPIQVKVTSLLKSEIQPFSQAISSPIYNGAGKWPLIVKLEHNIQSLSGPDFSFLSYFLCHVTLELAVSKSRPPVPYGANLFSFYYLLDNLNISTKNKSWYLMTIYKYFALLKARHWFMAMQAYLGGI